MGAAYDPFSRGPFPAGVRSLELTDAARGGRTLPVEVWYPATAEHAGRDLDDTTRDRYQLVPGMGIPPEPQDAVRDATPRPGRFPLVLFSHGYGGHRRQSTFLCTHLASHGYVVAAPDHIGNTVVDVIMVVMARSSGAPVSDPAETLPALAAARPADVRFLLDRLLAGEGGFGELLDPARIGIAGHSFGGWTTLATTASERRIRAALALAPAGGASPLPGDHLGHVLDLAWDREVPTLYVAAERDSILPLPGIREMYARNREPKRMVVMQNADHLHFCDRIEQVHELFRLMPQDPLFEPVRQSIAPITELCPAEHAYQTLRGLGLAHMDAHLKGHEPAARLMAGDLGALLAARGIDTAVL